MKESRAPERYKEETWLVPKSDSMQVSYPCKSLNQIKRYNIVA